MQKVGEGEKSSGEEKEATRRVRVLTRKHDGRMENREEDHEA